MKKKGKPGKMAVQRHGQYDGTFFGSIKWPELLIGHREIARYFRISPGTASNWLAQGRLPVVKDTRGRWMVARRVLEQWMLKGGPGLRQRRDERILGEHEIERDEVKEMGKTPTPSHSDPPDHTTVEPIVFPRNALLSEAKTIERPDGEPIPILGHNRGAR